MFFLIADKTLAETRMLPRVELVVVVAVRRHLLEYLLLSSRPGAPKPRASPWGP